MILMLQEHCARPVSVAAGIAVQDDADSAVVGDARIAREAAMDAAPTRSGARAADAMAPTWRLA